MAKKAKSSFDLRGDASKGKERLSEITQLLCAKQGRHVSATLDRANAFRIHKIPTGIFMLDWMTGGGIAFDRMTRFFGPKNSCKTTTMLKILAQSQKHCRHCKDPIVISPENGDKNCSCPNPRYVLKKASDIEFLGYLQALDIEKGKLPEGAKKSGNSFSIEVTPKGKRYEIELEESYRCEPMRSIFVETERKLDRDWARQLGVDTGLVVVVGCDWAESTIDNVEALVYSDELDILFIDTISVMVSKEDIQKSMEENPKLANRARVISRFISKLCAAQFRHGVLSDKKLTVVSNSQVRTQGIGSFATFLGPSDGNHFDHAISLDIEMRMHNYRFTNREYASFGIFDFFVRKNHTGGSSGVSGRFQMWIDPEGPYQVGDTDDLLHVVKYGREFDLITETGKSGSKYCFSSQHVKKDLGFATLKELSAFLQENPTLFMELRRKVLSNLINKRTKLEKPKESKVLILKEKKKD